MAKKIVVSEAGSFKGWQFSIWAKFLLEWRKWLCGLKNVLKTGAVLAAGLLSFYVLPWATSLWGDALAVGLVGFLTKLVLDSADYFFSRIELK